MFKMWGLVELKWNVKAVNLDKLNLLNYTETVMRKMSWNAMYVRDKARRYCDNNTLFYEAAGMIWWSGLAVLLQQ